MLSLSARPKYFLLNSVKCRWTFADDGAARGGGRDRGGDGCRVAPVEVLVVGCCFLSCVLMWVPRRTGVARDDNLLAVDIPVGQGVGRGGGREGPGRRAKCG